VLRNGDEGVCERYASMLLLLLLTVRTWRIFGVEVFRIIINTCLIV
jgi:hypothetical protein